jgi:eukaryotic-like serine/threonine-protein kinase
MVLADLPGDRFEIEYQIAGGGMGEVFRGRDRASGTAVAIKVVTEARAHHTARFAREAELLSELSHPGIVRYIAHGQTATGQPFLVMEWLDGEDLLRRLQHGPLTMAEAVALATRVAAALGTAHARGIVHRDLKPSNLFLPGGHIDQVKVLDFGIAHREGCTQLTRTGAMIGTPGYMAPEQARSNAPVDARADVFALGCVLFQCLTGTAAFEGDSPVAILGKILFSEAPRVSALWPEAPEDLDALVAAMLAKDPALRPSDGANLAAALAALGLPLRSSAMAPRERVALATAITGGERRLLSVVLLGGAADPDPAELALERAIRPYGGRLEQLADGSTLVLFAADRQVATDQAARAARCALAMRAISARRPLAIAIGRIGSTQPGLPEAEVIDRASRVISHGATPHQGRAPIALDDASAGLLDARFDVVETDTGPMLLGERAVMQGARTLLGRPTSCVGRDWELGALGGIFDECIDESSARVALVIAPAGMGKSRLGAEFVSRIHRRCPELAIWVGRGNSLRAGSTLDLLAQALRGALGIHGGEPLAERHDKIRTRVAEHVPAADQHRVAEFLGELVGAPFPDGAASGALRTARQDAQLMGEQLRRAWLDFLDAETSAHPVLLVLEDLHWGDFGTMQFVDTALRDRAARPWMVLALARPEVFEVFPRLWADRRNIQALRLKELGRKASERLVRQVLGDSVGPRTIERLIQQADGNAFYLEELIRAAAEGKDRALPETVLAMVETRLARLADDARRVLRAASVFGEVCWETGVSALLRGAMGDAMVSEWLTRLVEQEVLTMRPSSRFPGECELAFRHALLREGAYATLTKDDRRLAHGLAGDWLASHGEADPMVLASHFERSGLGERAASYYLRASEQAFFVLDVDATMARAGLGLACAPPPELRMALLGIRCELSSCRWQLIPDTMPEAEELIRSASRGSVFWAQGMTTYIYGTLIAGRMDELLASIALLREVDLAPDAVGKMGLVLLISICVLDNLGRVAEGSALEDRFFAIVRATEDREPIVRFWWNIAVGMRASYAHDHPWDGLQHSAAIQAIYDAIGGENILLNMQVFRGLNLWYLGTFADAQRTLESLAAADEALGMASSLRRLGLSWLYADRGDLGAARTLADQLSKHGEAVHSPPDEGRGRWVLAEVLRRMGDLDGADRELQVALERVVALDRPGVLATLSMLRLAQGRAGEALAAAEDAVSRYIAMGGCGLFRGAFVRLAHAEALHAIGDGDAARRAIGHARTQLLAIADKIPDPAYRRSFLGNVPENARILALARAWLDDAAPSS